MTDEKKKYRIVVMGGSFNPPTLWRLSEPKRDSSSRRTMSM